MSSFHFRMIKSFLAGFYWAITSLPQQPLLFLSPFFHFIFRFAHALLCYTLEGRRRRRQCAFTFVPTLRQACSCHSRKKTSQGGFSLLTLHCWLLASSFSSFLRRSPWIQIFFLGVMSQQSMSFSEKRRIKASSRNRKKEPVAVHKTHFQFPPSGGIEVGGITRKVEEEKKANEMRRGRKNCFGGTEVRCVVARSIN